MPPQPCPLILFGYIPIALAHLRMGSSTYHQFSLIHRFNYILFRFKTNCWYLLKHSPTSWSWFLSALFACYLPVAFFWSSFVLFFPLCPFCLFCLFCMLLIIWLSPAREHCSDTAGKVCTEASTLIILQLSFISLHPNKLIPLFLFDLHHLPVAH